MANKHQSQKNHGAAHKNADSAGSREIFEILVSAITLAIVWIISAANDGMSNLLRVIMFLVPYLIAGHDVLLEAVEKIFRRQFLEEDFLMSIASIGALLVGEYPEAVAVMLFYRIGELFEEYAVGKSRRSIASLLNLRPDYACMESGSQLVKVKPESVRPGTIIVVSPGERIPLDGVVVSGSSALDTSALTGESMPRSVSAGSTVNSGCININGVLKIQTSCSFKESTVSKILDMAEHAAKVKSRKEAFITRFARVYTPVVVAIAVLLAIIPSLFTGQWSTWVSRALIFLVISCPCALVVSVPLSFFSGMGCASKHGILIKGSGYLEALSDVSTVVMDKTGTVTEGSFSVTSAEPVGISADDLINLAAAAESFSNHPIALSLRKAATAVPDQSMVTDVREIPGRGVSATVYGRRILAGNAALMDAAGIQYTAPAQRSSIVHVAVNGSYAGYICIDDRIKDGAKDAVRELFNLGVDKTVMLTGDGERTGRAVAYALGVKDVMTDLLPGDKLVAVEELLREKTGGNLLFVGDGVNDAPVLARADVGVAMGIIGSDAAIEAADIVLMDDDFGKLPLAIMISKRTMKIVKQNIVFALLIKFAIMVLGAFGIAGMWLAVFADVGVLILAIMNAARAMVLPKSI